MTTKNMTNKIALITGGNRGLGKSTALHLAASGADVIFTYRSNADEARAVVAAIEQLGRRAAALQLDTAKLRSFAAFTGELKTVLAGWQRERIDFLVNNAGYGSYASIADTTEEQFDAMIDVHFKGVLFLTQALLPLIADGGRIVNISSGLTRFTFEGRAMYAAAKGAVEVFSRYLAQELGPRGIAVNVVAPGAIATDFGGGTVRDNPAVSAHLAALTPLGRVGVADDIGGAVAALLLPANGWINGQRIEISGGIHL